MKGSTLKPCAAVLLAQQLHMTTGDLLPAESCAAMHIQHELKQWCHTKRLHNN